MNPTKLQAAVKGTNVDPSIVEMFINSVAADPDLSLELIHDGSDRDDMHPGPGVWLRDGTNVDAIVVARCSLGNWTVLTTTGRIVQFLATEVF